MAMDAGAAERMPWWGWAAPVAAWALLGALAAGLLGTDAAWVVALACRKAKELGYPHELWTTRLLAEHARRHGPQEGHASLARLAQGTVCKILDAQEVKAHKVRYYLEKRDPAFADKMAEVLCVYREVEILKKKAAAALKRKRKPSDGVAIVSYDEKPGIQANRSKDAGSTTVACFSPTIER